MPRSLREQRVSPHHSCTHASKQALAHHLAWGTCPAQSHSSTQVPAGSLDRFGYKDRQAAQRLVQIQIQIQIQSGWDSASTGHLVCLVQACVKGLYLYGLGGPGLGLDVLEDCAPSAALLLLVGHDFPDSEALLATRGAHLPEAEHYMWAGGKWGCGTKG